ncbi:MAG: preprotein translocase subunit SecY [Clostridia bacterium]|nr:preprotein translocase subunit SecY [Clostridia bacterium]
MFQTLRNAWKIPDLRKKILYTVFLLVVFRFGSHIPVPWIDSAAISTWLDSADGNSLFNLLDMFSGGAFSNATIFAMSISPYINSSIIMQLLTVAIPALERMSKEGEEGRKKITQITRWLTVVLAALQAFGLYVTLHNQSAINVPAGLPGWLVALTIVLAFTAGTAFLMWLGEEITGKGIGNGISMLIFAGIVARIPTMAYSAYNNFSEWYWLVLLLVYALVSIMFVVLVNSAERRLPVQYAKRVVGRKMYGGQSSYIPIKVAMAGVIPIIFAMSIMSFPGTLAMLFGQSNGGVLMDISNFITGGALYPLLYFLLIVGFTYFYTSITFNPVEVSNNIKKNNGAIPGLRPGKPTSDYIAKVLSRITLAGAIFLAIVAVLPIIISLFTGKALAELTLSGTSLLIVVGVALETVKQIESQMLMRHYKGFLE